MSYVIGSRAAWPLLGLSVRAVPSASARAPSAQALRWLSQVVSKAQYRNPTSNAPRCSTRPRYAQGSAVLDCANRRTFFSRRPRIVKQYENLPKEYQDQMGLDFRPTDLSQDEVDRVFRRGSISSIDANTLLRILHGRRVAGTLDDPAYAPNTSYFTDEQMETALEYLRITVPVEEALNAGLRAEDELAQMDREAVLKSKRAAAAAAAAEAAKSQGQEDAVAQKQQDHQQLEQEPAPSLLYKPDPIYGASKFDEIRAKNDAKSEAIIAARAAREKAEAAAAEAKAAAKAGPVALISEEGRQIMNPRIAEYYKKAQAQGLEEPELIPFWQRILPSATFTVLVLGFLAALTAVYEEPADKYRMMGWLTTSQATIAALIGVNTLVWIGWKIPPMWALFNRYMVFVVGAVKPVTLFTAQFSHQSWSHLLINMVPLYFVGMALHDELDRATFLTLYAACGAMGYLGSLVTYTLRGWLATSSLGASGATLGIISAYFWEHKMDGFKFFGLPPDGVHGIVFLAFLAAIQISHFGRMVKSRTDLASHIAGMLTGVAGAEVIGWSRRRSMAEKLEKDGKMVKNEKVVIEAGDKAGASPDDGEGQRTHIDVFGFVSRWVASFGGSKGQS